MSIEVHTVPIGHDNYAFVVAHGNEAFVVDPGEAAPVAELLRRNSLNLTHVLLTHHHGDHTGGGRALARATGCLVAGPDRRCGTLDVETRDGASICAAGIDIGVMAVPGHTATHVAYTCDAPSMVFTGDTLFASGCGRIFEGTAETMYLSLARIAAMAPDTLVYCGHEYTLDNCEFACAQFPHDTALAQRLAQVRAQRAAREATVPSTIARELACNVFLRAEDPTAFSHLRALKDRW